MGLEFLLDWLSVNFQDFLWEMLLVILWVKRLGSLWETLWHPE
jgi:hypothetical protein